MTGGFRDHFTAELGDASDRAPDGRVHSSWSGSHPARLDHSRVDRRMACRKACPRPGLWLHRGHSPGIDRVGGRRLDLHEAGHRSREYFSDFTRSRDGRSSGAGFNCASFFWRPQPLTARPTCLQRDFRRHVPEGPAWSRENPRFWLGSHLNEVVDRALRGAEPVGRLQCFGSLDLVATVLERWQRCQHRS